MSIFPVFSISFIRQQRYMLVCVVFFLSAYYHYAVIPIEKIKKNISAQEKVVTIEQGELNLRTRERVYENIFQSQQGDIFRIGLVVKVDHPQHIEVSLQSSLNERVKIGDFNITPKQNGEYKELIFSAPGYYSDIVLRLKEVDEEKSPTWNDARASVRCLFVTRVDVHSSWEIRSLLPTVFGLSQKKDSLALLEQKNALLDYARVEDLGKTLFYEYSSRGEETDYTNLFAASKDIRFDSKKNLVVGSKKKGEFFTYKFDTLYPFERFTLKAEQAGKNQGELRLEYSLDMVIWHQAPFVQEEGGPQKFSAFILGGQEQTVVYVRVSYNAKEKQTGTFALGKLSVNAAMSKSFN